MRRRIPASVLLVLILSWAPRLSAETALLVEDVDAGGGAFSIPPSGFLSVTRSGATLVFSACDGFVQGVWRSDGTAEGTFALPGDTVSCASLDRPDPVAAGGLGFYLLRSPSGKLHLWRTDGTAAGTFRITPDDIGPVSDLTVFGNGVAFRVGDRIWRADGSLLGTHPYAFIPTQAVEPRALQGVGPWLFFLARGLGSVNEQLWISDGTEPGTYPLTDFHTSAFDPGAPLEIALAGAAVFFAALDRLWKTDGTAAGTTQLLTSPAEGTSPADFAVFQDTLFFMAGTNRTAVRRALWRSNGTPAGTTLVGLVGTPEGVPAWLTVRGDRLFFAGDDGVHGLELWSTDGTFNGTRMARDVAPGAASAHPAWIAAAGSRVFFAANDGASGIELWESDGSAAGTQRVQDVVPGGLSSTPEELTLVGDRLFFAAEDGVHGREPWVLAPGGSGGGCVPSTEALCLGGRFRVTADWRDFEGLEGDGHAVALTGDTGYFWFFNAANVEVVLKVLDGRGVNGHHWVFYGALSSVEYTLTVTDTETGAVRRYENPSGRLASVADTEAFDTSSAADVVPEGPEPFVEEPFLNVWDQAAAATCAPSSTRLCLNGGRFAVEARWTDFQGNSGAGQAVPLPGGDTGYFWFFGPDNVEVMLKVLDGRPLNNKFWVFFGALSSVEYTLTVTDTQTGTVKTYTNPSGRLASVADTGAF